MIFHAAHCAKGCLCWNKEFEKQSRNERCDALGEGSKEPEVFLNKATGNCTSAGHENAAEFRYSRPKQPTDLMLVAFARHLNRPIEPSIRGILTHYTSVQLSKYHILAPRSTRGSNVTLFCIERNTFPRGNSPPDLFGSQFFPRVYYVDHPKLNCSCSLTRFTRMTEIIDFHGMRFSEDVAFCIVYDNRR
jgi:hypothetical protein